MFSGLPFSFAAQIRQFCIAEYPLARVKRLPEIRVNDATAMFLKMRRIRVRRPDIRALSFSKYCAIRLSLPGGQDLNDIVRLMSTTVLS
jgi:hypothetical protein